ncbi:MAG TPA: metalloregulator ArsR/SmtB family transcription factor [Vicinamibacteria bacterium]|nr:metalloregulator ArsR/SmtB family transcription factor [Vicinamibacteria bacterium]
MSARPSAAPIFAALGDETRLRLISRLCDEGPLSITKLSVGFDVTRQAITKHLYTMADAGLLRSRREGRESLWEVRPERLEDARHSLELISKQWDHSLARLKKLVEE